MYLQIMSALGMSSTKLLLLSWDHYSIETCIKGICLEAWNPDWHNRNLSALQISQWLNSEPWYWRQSIFESVVYFNHQIWLSATKCFTQWHESIWSLNDTILTHSVRQGSVLEPRMRYMNLYWTRTWQNMNLHWTSGFGIKHIYLKYQNVVENIYICIFSP